MPTQLPLSHKGPQLHFSMEDHVPQQQHSLARTQIDLEQRGLSALCTLAFYIGTHTYITNEGTLATCLVVMPLVLATHDRGIPPD